MKSYRFVVSGRVQGVSYRRYVCEVAHAFGYVGYVRNLMDLSVEVVANIDDQEEVEFFITKLYEGSLFSSVQDVTMQTLPLQSYEGFEVRYGLD